MQSILALVVSLGFTVPISSYSLGRVLAGAPLWGPEMTQAEHDVGFG